jgi:hypothetical protein
VSAMLSADEYWVRGVSQHSYFITDEEFAELLNTRLPKRLEPYRLIVLPSIREGGEWALDAPVITSVDSYLDWTEQRRVNFFYLVSTVLTPCLSFPEGTNAPLSCDVNGFIRICSSTDTNRFGRTPMTLTVFTKVFHKDTGAVIEHREYVSLHRALRKGARSVMRYKTLWGNTPSPENEKCLMSEGVAKRIAAGERYMARPGSAI